jgi:hypothetical protein
MPATLVCRCMGSVACQTVEASSSSFSGGAATLQAWYHSQLHFSWTHAEVSYQS